MRSSWILYTARAAMLESWSKRSAFVLDVGVMCVNNMTWLAFWAIFFHNTGSIRGWEAGDLFLYFAILCSVFGIVSGFLANLRRLGLIVANGELDAALTVPADTLVYIALRRVNASGIGDFVFGTAVFLVIGQINIERLALFISVVILGAVVLASFLVAIGSASFFTRGEGDQAQLAYDAIGVFAMYPTDFFGGIVKLMLFTVLPTAFVTGIPVDLLTDFSWSWLLPLAIAAIAAAVGSRAIFYAGLRRYRSGSRWTSA